MFHINTTQKILIPRSMPRRHQYCLVSLRIVLILVSAVTITGLELRTAHVSKKTMPTTVASWQQRTASSMHFINMEPKETHKQKPMLAGPLC